MPGTIVVLKMQLATKKTKVPDAWGEAKIEDNR